MFQAISAAIVPNRFFGLNKHIFYKLKRGENSFSQNNNEVNIVAGTESSVVDVVNDIYSGDPQALKFYENFYRNGIELWIAKVNDRVVGSVWLYTGTYLANWEGYEAWLLQIGIEPTAKFVANVFVDPLFRGRRIFPAIINFCTNVYKEEEFYSCVDELNSTSVNAHERIGFKSCGAAYYVRFFQKTYCIFFTKNKKNRWQHKFFRLPRGEAIPVSISNQQ
ncbi:MAG: GNAT family N-acetyltransferase [Planctomycetaceae bacterium]|nr:GNAT family N-acetyltransferase [Planctomycetaceae bacterium]